ncbi:hypothetical protein PUP72_02460 [Pseudomonas synxantha]|uniref:hypothetical protein n=1 Tax=Pseudomonas synxantha TaxID=47883 RepID=UPI002367C005|nr:hypothetical protein [Pseudomonas synxantha]WDG42879.1 hypothetical protein PUP72_02460 [Pseudomonas synxantha]
MDWMQFVSALVSALAWPSAVVVVVCLLKNPILGLIPKIRSFKYGELHVDLTEALQSLQEDLPAAPSEPEAQPSKPRVEISIPLQIAAVSPRAGMIAAWLEVESALNVVLTREGEERPDLLPPRKKLDLAFNLGHIDRQQHDAFVRTSRLRNEAIHMLDRDITYEDAVAMVDVCKRLAESLHNPTPPVHGPHF